MTAPPCPSAEQLARDPNLCPICGHWCGRHSGALDNCERRWASYRVPDLIDLVNKWRRIRFDEHGENFNTPLDRDAFNAWLNAMTEA